MKAEKPKHGVTIFCMVCKQRRRKVGGVYKDKKTGEVIGYACLKCGVKQHRREENAKRGTGTKDAQATAGRFEAQKAARQ
jgi:hypothetical protein